MKNNKSIDGLSTRSAKKQATPTISSQPKISSTPKKVVKKPAATKKPVKVVKVATAPKIQKEAPATTKEQPQEVINLTDTDMNDFLKPVQAFDFDGDSGELVASSQKSKKDKKAKKLKKKPGKARRIIVGILLVIVFSLIGLVTWAVLWGNDIIAKITGGQGNILDLFTFMEESYEPLKTDSKGRTNILAFGTSGYNMDGDEGNGVHDGAQLTDSIMVISIDQETGDAVMLSLPRDLKASPTCTATGKINEVYWCNNMYGDNEQAGAEALMAEVSDILGIDFQYYAHVNWGSLVQIVDTLGGIKVTLDEDIQDYYWTGAVFEAGTEYEINGEQALGLARARHGTIGGDFSRGASQQKILIGIKNKLLEKHLSISDLISLASTLGDNLRTNFNLEEIKTLAHLSTVFDLETMRQVSLLNYNDGIYYMTTGTLDNGISYVFPAAGVGVYGPIQDYVAKMFSSDPRTYEDSTILILNATDEAGLAATEKRTLEDEGYIIDDIDNTSAKGLTDNYTLYATNNAPGTKKLLEKHYNIDAKSIDDLPEGVTHDYDFVIILSPSSPEEE